MVVLMLRRDVLKQPLKSLSIEAVKRSAIEATPEWINLSKQRRKDRRFYELVEDTIPGFEYYYFVLRNSETEIIQAIQPFTVSVIDTSLGLCPRLQRWVKRIRYIYPWFLRFKALIVGCILEEGHLDGNGYLTSTCLADNITDFAVKFECSLILFKSFGKQHRQIMTPLTQKGFTRVPCGPMAFLKLNFKTFEEYMKMLSRNMRSKLRRKFKESEKIGKLEMQIVTDITPFIEQAYPLYEDVFNKSKFKFEKLTPEFFCELGKRMPERVKFFLWFLDGKLVIFNVCTMYEKSFYSEFIGLDYKVAYDMHLYYVFIRDVMNWVLKHDFDTYHSGALNYEPKYHLRHDIHAHDLYIKHRSRLFNFLLKHALPYLEPARHDPILKMFPNYKSLYE
jgi:hypothetical protein